MLRRFIDYYKPHRKLFFADLFFAFLLAVCDLFYPMIAKNIINEYVPDKNLRLLLIWSAVLLGIYLLKAGFNYFVNYYGHIVGVRMQADMRRDVFRRLQKLPFSFYDENKTGSIMSRIINDLMDISELAHHGPEDLFLSLVMLVASFAILCTINVPLTLIIFLTLPFIIYFSMRLRKNMKAAFTKSREEIAEVNAGLENSIAGIRMTRAYTGAEHETWKFERQNQRFVSARSAAYKIMAVFTTGSTLFTDVLYLLVLVAGGLFFFQDRIDAGEFAAYLLYVNSFLNPIKRFVAFFEQYQNGITGFQRFEELMAQEEEREEPNASDVHQLAGAIDFDHVSFQYEGEKEEGSGRYIIQDLSLHIDQGKTVALVGPSGGGKTTLCHLIPRFYDATAGQVMVDGVPVTDYPFSQLRGQIGVVPQQAVLFAGTLRENMQWRKRDASDEEISRALEIAQAAEFVSKLPEGLDTMIQQGGRNLSGGQRQRLTIARALVGTPQILILDDSASALDFATDAALRKALRQQTRDMTVFMVSQRAGTVRAADRIVVLDDGRIVGIGPHSELFETCAVYREICLSQMNEEEAAG